MNLIGIKFISFGIIFILSFLIHFVYKIFHFPIVTFFVPVNESIWEHLKILYTSIIIGSIFEYFFLNFFGISYNNFILQLVVTCYLAVIIFLIIYLPIYNLFGENLFISILLMALVYVFVIFISYFIMNSYPVVWLNKIVGIFLVFGYLIFGYLTYYPLNNYIFYDTLKGEYGIRRLKK